MAALDALVGNDALKADLLAALRAGRLCQSVLLLGEEGVGTGFAARCLAADHMYPEGGDGARQVLAGESPECLSVRGEGASNIIRVERIRDVRAEIFNTALSSAGRAVIVYGAHRLNQSSANALLKTLEEPPADALFILTAPSAANVLPTVRSRCCAYSLAPVSEEACAAALKKEFPALRDAARYAALFGGRIGSAKKCLATAGGKALLTDALALCECAGAKDTYGAMVLLAKYEKARQDALALLRLTRTVCGAALTGPAAEIPLSPERAAAFATAAGEALRLLDRNVNTKLVLTDLALECGKRG